MDERLVRVQDAMRSEGLDALVAHSLENVYYVLGVWLETLRVIPDRLTFVVLTASGDRTVVVCASEEAQVRAESGVVRVISYTEFQQAPVDVLAEVLREHGLDEGRIGVERQILPDLHAARLRARLPEARWSACDGLLERARAIKTPREIRQLEEAALATDRAIGRALDGARPGVTERDLARRFQTALLEEGADYVAFCVMTSGRNSLITHPHATSIPIPAGTSVRTDSGGLFGGYYSDLARTAYVGGASREQQETYRWLWDVHTQLIEAMRPGTRIADLYDLCRRLYEARGLPWTRAHIGHSLGLTVHERPMIAPQTQEELRPGMTLCIEPNYVVPDREKYHVEDLVLITEDAPRILSRSRDWSRPW